MIRELNTKKEWFLINYSTFYWELQQQQWPQIMWSCLRSWKTKSVSNQSINQYLYSAPCKIPTQRRSWPRPSGKEQSLEGGGIENRHRLEGTLDLLEVHSRFLDQPPKMNGPALSQSGRMGPPNYREQRTGVHDGLNVCGRFMWTLCVGLQLSL